MAPSALREASVECLCVGTSGKDWRDVLRRLSEWPCVKRILPCPFE